MCGPSGGCDAALVTLDEVADTEDFHPTQHLTVHDNLAEFWMKKAEKQLMKAKFRAGVQPDDVPMELLRVVLAAKPSKIEKNWHWL